jgi:phage tail-like protein
MAEPRNDTIVHPFTAFNFAVEITVGDSGANVCNAAFSECDGLEMTMDVKTVREGGNSTAVIRLAGPPGHGQVTLKRGMTASFDLWDWFSAVAGDPTIRGEGEIRLLASDGVTERARFRLGRCLPVKLKAPPLNAKDGVVAIEELQLVYDTLTFEGGGGG